MSEIAVGDRVSFPHSPNDSNQMATITGTVAETSPMPIGHVSIAVDANPYFAWRVIVRRANLTRAATTPQETEL